MKNLTTTAKKELLKADGTCKKIYADTIKEFAHSTTIHPVTYTGRGRHINVRDMSAYIGSALRLMGYKYTTGNDAPKGGKLGFYFKVSNTALNAIKELSSK